MKTILFIFISTIALTALGSGLLLISNPDGSMLQLDTLLLQSTPFKDFTWPGIILAGAVGGINLAAVVLNMQRNAKRYTWSLAAGIMICGWILVQVNLIRSLHWLHFIYLGMGIGIILISLQLKGKALI